MNSSVFDDNSSDDESNSEDSDDSDDIENRSEAEEEDTLSILEMEKLTSKDLRFLSKFINSKYLDMGSRCCC